MQEKVLLYRQLRKDVREILSTLWKLVFNPYKTLEIYLQ